MKTKDDNKILNYLIQSNQQSLIKKVQLQVSLDFLQITDQDGNNPIHIAINRNHFSLIKQYVATIRRILSLNNIRQKQSKYISEQRIRFRISYHLNLTNKIGITPLHTAAFHGNFEIIKFLEENGAKLHLTTDTGLNVLHFASQNDQAKIIYYFLNKIQLTKCDINGNSPLHWACYNNSRKVVQLLIQREQIIDMPNNDGNTGLHLAIKNRNAMVAKQLLQAGANRELKNNKNKRPYDLTNDTVLHNILCYKKKCSNAYYYSPPRQPKNIFITILIPILLSLLLCFNQFCLSFTDSILNSIFLYLPVTILSILTFGIFVHLTGVLNTKQANKSINISEIQSNNFCFRCNQQKIATTFHCKICRKCTNNHYKHISVFDNCLDKNDVKCMIVFIVMVIILVCICLMIAVVVLQKILTENNQQFKYQFVIVILDQLLIVLLFLAIRQLHSCIVFQMNTNTKTIQKMVPFNEKFSHYYQVNQQFQSPIQEFRPQKQKVSYIAPKSVSQIKESLMKGYQQQL